MNKQKLASGSIKGTKHHVFVTYHDELGLLLESVRRETNHFLAQIEQEIQTKSVPEFEKHDIRLKRKKTDTGNYQKFINEMQNYTWKTAILVHERERERIEGTLYNKLLLADNVLV